MTTRLIRSLATSLVVLTCITSRSASMQQPPPQRGTVTRGIQVYRDAIVIDTHNDLPSRMVDDGYNPDVRHEPGFGKAHGETDLPRLLESGVTAEFLSAFVDGKFALEKPDQSWHRVGLVIDSIHAFVTRHPDQLIFATTAADVRRAKKQGKVAIFIGVEGGHAIENSLDKLRQLSAKGVRYMTLTHNNGNDWAGSSIGTTGTRTGGLTVFGKQVVVEMNRLGMLVDVSHVSDSTFYDVIATSRAPIIASHSSSRALGGHPRDMSDDMLRAVGKNGGVVNVNFYNAFLDPKYFAAKDAIEKKMEAERVAAAGRPGADTAKLRAEYEKKTDDLVRAIPRPPLSLLIDHIDHVARVAGVDHTGIGSDFDGVTGLLPADMLDVTYLSRISQALLDRGYSEADVKKILGVNMLRVMEMVMDGNKSR